ncbi:MAG: dCTP deaminase [Thermoguttaceae bacterium]|nr:dCTP deaminase [Thermoguttaceae bacterium]
MMILSGLEIAHQIELGRITIDPFDPERLNPNSYNLRLANKLLVYDSPVLDMRNEPVCTQLVIPESGLLLTPGELYLGRTVERTKTDRFVPMLEGRSSIGRLGLAIHVTAGFGDIGFTGFWTLEIYCLKPVRVYPNVEICQIYYHTILGDYQPYSSGKYQDNSGIQPSLLFHEFKENL